MLSQDLYAFLQQKNIFSPTIRVFPLSNLHLHTTCVCVFNVTKCDTNSCVSPIVLNLYVINIQMWCTLPLYICSCIVFHMTPTGNSRAMLSSNRRWNVCMKINRQKLRIQKIAYDNNFILAYSEHNCVHSFYSFVSLFDAV